MKIAQIDDVELISIKTKSLQDLDNEINFNLNSNKLNQNEFISRENKKYEIFIEEGHEKEEKEEKEELEEESDNDHYESSVRFLTIEKSPNGACGFYLTRTKWDPYPWVSAVDNFTPAAKSDLKAGDCVLEVNGCDVLGLRITEIAKLVKSTQHQVTLLLWSSNCNAKCDKENLCAAPMPRSLQRLSLVVQTILSLIECPVCLDTITPPATQCQNGHLLCIDCRIRAEKCPVCRDRYFPRPALIVEQIQSAITSAFNLCLNEDKVRQKIFGRHNRQRQMVKTTLDYLQQKQPIDHQLVDKSLRENPLQEGKETNTITTTETVAKINRKCDGKRTEKSFKYTASSSIRNKTTCNKFITIFLNSRAYSMENLTNIQSSSTATITNQNFNTCQTTTKTGTSQFELLDKQHVEHNSLHAQVGKSSAVLENLTPIQQQYQQKPSATSRHHLFIDSTRNVATNQYSLIPYKTQPNSIENDLNINTKLCCEQILDNKKNNFSLSSDKYLTKSKESIKCLLDSPVTYINHQNGIIYPAMVCETSYATVPRAIKLMDKLYKEKKSLSPNTTFDDNETAINFVNSNSV